uniref:conjugal transfer protein TraF n=1 Tax=Salmonella enterica TaxID=28901 RepID=UPI000B056320
FSICAKKSILAHPELEYKMQNSNNNGTERNQLAADKAQQTHAISKLAEQYGIMGGERGKEKREGKGERGRKGEKRKGREERERGERGRGEEKEEEGEEA